MIHILGMTNLRLYIFPAGGNEIALPWGCGPQRPSELGGSNLSPVYGRDSHRTLKSAPRPVVTLSRKAEAQDSFQSPVCCGRHLVPAWTQTGSLRCPRTVCVSQPYFSEDAATCMGDSRSTPRGCHRVTAFLDAYPWWPLVGTLLFGRHMWGAAGGDQAQLSWTHS